MHRFFISESPAVGAVARITGDELMHLRGPLRVRPGDRVILCDGRRTDFICEVTSIGSGCAEAAVLRALPSVGEPPADVTLYQALPKGDKMDGIVKRAVELGAARVVPVLCARCVATPDAKRLEGRIRRWQAIAREAAKQSGRGIVPEVAQAMPFADALRDAGGAALRLIPYECERARMLGDALHDKRPAATAFFIGPEGGFEPEEHRAAQAAGCVSVSLGPRILRTETASAFVLSALMYEWERAAPRDYSEPEAAARTNTIGSD